MPSGPTISIIDGKFDPPQININLGSDVTFENQMTVQVSITLPACFPLSSSNPHDIASGANLQASLTLNPATNHKYAIIGSSGTTPDGVLETPELEPGEIIVVE